jgi:hypothetical protein
MTGWLRGQWVLLYGVRCCWHVSLLRGRVFSKHKRMIASFRDLESTLH